MTRFEKWQNWMMHPTGPEALVAFVLFVGALIFFGCYGLTPRELKSAGIPFGTVGLFCGIPIYAVMGVIAAWRKQ